MCINKCATESNYPYFASRINRVVWPTVMLQKHGIKIPCVSPKVKFLLPNGFLLLIIIAIVLVIIYIMVTAGLRNYLRTLKWTPIPLGAGFALIAYQQLKHTRQRELSKLGQSSPCDCLADNWEVEAYKLLPLRSFSRFWGWFTGIELPSWSRNYLLGMYVRAFGCKMEEAEIEQLDQYKCLSELFRRGLKEGARVLDKSSGLISPVDGTVLSFGAVDCGALEQIKGVTYSIREFLGPNCWRREGPMVTQRNDDSCFHRNCLYNGGNNELFQCVFYLAPGDYHRFHSPTDWNVKFRRHFPGELLSVNPSIASWIRNLFVLNERVTYVGNWAHGFFSMTAVGATNVGSVKVYFDDSLKTNERKWNKTNHFDKHFSDLKEMSIGEKFGEFNLGSTIVLIFEAPKGTKLNLEAGQKIKLGESLLKLPSTYVCQTSHRKNIEGVER